MTANAAPNSLLPVLAERWSPRSFDAKAEVSADVINRILEAARWAPSARNLQPWKFVAAQRGSSTFNTILEFLAEPNRLWAQNASVLIANVVTTPENPAGSPEYDLGQAVFAAVTQAHAEGLHAHQMGGLDATGLTTALELGSGERVLTVTAIGFIADPQLLPAPFAERETAPRTRKELSEISRVTLS